MQTTPDTSKMFDKGDEWKIEAKKLFSSDQARLLHDLFLCEYFERNQVESGSILTFKEIYFEKYKIDEEQDFDLSQFPNYSALSELMENSYITDCDIYSFWIQQLSLEKSRLLLKPMNWMLLLQSYIQELLRRISSLLEIIKTWQQEHPLPTEQKVDEIEKSWRYDSMIMLESLCIEEHAIIMKSSHLVDAKIKEFLS
jgi:hypothetical protein